MSLEELFDILLKENASDILRIKEEELFALIPELRTCKDFNQNSDWHIYDVFEHILHVIDNVPHQCQAHTTGAFRHQRFLDRAIHQRVAVHQLRFRLRQVHGQQLS